MAILLSACVLAPAAAAQLLPGDVLVVDPDVPPVSTGMLFQVDPVTGARTVLSNFGSGNPTGVALEADGSILVTATEAGTDPTGGTTEWGALYRLRSDPVTGDVTRTVLSDFGAGASAGRNPRAVAVEANGQILVLNGTGGGAERALLVRIDPATGSRSVVSDFGDATQGGIGIEPRGVAVERDGSILVIDAQAGFGGAGSGQGELVRIDPQTGNRTSLSNFGQGANPGSNPTSVTAESTSQILVTDEGHPSTTPLGLLFRVDPLTGLRTILSDFNVGANTGREPEGVAVEPDGQILVIDKHAGPVTRGMLFRVDPLTGGRTIVSDFGSGPNQGGDPLALAIVPPAAPPQGPCILLSETAVSVSGPASRPSTPGFANQPRLTITNCGAADVNLRARGTNAAGTSGTWQLTNASSGGTVDSTCGLGLNIFRADLTLWNSVGGGSGTPLTTSDTTVLGEDGSTPFLLAAAAAQELSPSVELPCVGSVGLGDPMNTDITLTAFTP